MIEAAHGEEREEVRRWTGEEDGRERGRKGRRERRIWDEERKGGREGRRRG